MKKVLRLSLEGFPVWFRHMAGRSQRELLLKVVSRIDHEEALRILEGKAGEWSEPKAEENVPDLDSVWSGK